MTALLLALGSNISFSFASTVFADFSKRISPEWMNFHKAFVAWICFILTFVIFGSSYALSSEAVFLFLASGIIGLFIGDTFLLKAFAELGSGRTLMVFGFQPLLLGTTSYFLFGQTMPLVKFVAVIFLIGCVFSFALESSKSQGHWGARGLIFAMAGVIFDAAGLLMTRHGFDISPGLSPFIANLIRTSGALAGFLIWMIGSGKGSQLFGPFLKMNARDRFITTFAGALGTFVSLSLYLYAVQIGHLASISAIAGTAPVIATIFETATGRRPLTPHLFAGACFFLIGFAILTLA